MGACFLTHAPEVGQTRGRSSVPSVVQEPTYDASLRPSYPAFLNIGPARDSLRDVGRVSRPSLGQSYIPPTRFFLAPSDARNNEIEIKTDLHLQSVTNRFDFFGWIRNHCWNRAFVPAIGRSRLVFGAATDGNSGLWNGTCGWPFTITRRIVMTSPMESSVAIGVEFANFYLDVDVETSLRQSNQKTVVHYRWAFKSRRRVKETCFIARTVANRSPENAQIF